MKVFLAGATGVLGRGLVAELQTRGHDVVGLSRSDANDLTLQRLGATPKRADLFDAASLAKAAEGCEVVVRAATHISTKPKPTDADWSLNDRIRREGTRALLDAARRVGARRYVQESIAWLARPDDGAPFTEASPPRPDRVTASALDAERMAAEARGLQTATLRLGFLYGPETAHTRQFAAMLRKRRLPVIQPGTAPLSFLHTQDAARALADAVEGDAAGLYHVVDDRPTPIGQHLDDFAALLHAPRPMRVPQWLGRLGAGAYVTRFLTTPMVTRADAFKRAFGWKPIHATTDEGLRNVVERWKTEGFEPGR